MFVFEKILCGALVLGAAMAGGCGGQGRRPADAPAGLTPVVMQLDWFAEPEHGGFFQAEARGWYKEAGLDVTLLPGGPNANVHQKLATSQAQFGQSDSTNTLLAIAQGLPLVNVAAVFQEDPSVLMLHAENPVSGFEELNGKTIMARPEWVFLSYLRKKYGIEFNLIPQSFGLGQFVADPQLIQQGFYIAEPFFLKKEGVSPKFLHPWQAGYEAYVVVAANRDWVAAHRNAAGAFVAVTIRGWRDYLEGDPAPAHERMMALNDKASPEYLAFSRRMMIDDQLVTGREKGAENIGRITRARFEKQIRQLEELGLLERGSIAVEDVMDDGLASSAGD